jgi:hypothetical protein
MQGRFSDIGSFPSLETERNVMTKMRVFSLLTIAVVVGSCAPAEEEPPEPMMSFFLTSAGPGSGASLGGLDGADAYCQSLATSVEADGTWHAYLSAAATADAAAVNARDRIGTGPWLNRALVEVASDVANLHSENNNLTKETVLNERGGMTNGRGDTPNRHDILTGSNLDGTLAMGDGDTTCDNWTSSGEGSAMVGHFDRTGGGANPNSWNSAHASSGCSQENLQGTGGDGLFYCFAV